MYKRTDGVAICTNQTGLPFPIENIDCGTIGYIVAAVSPWLLVLVGHPIVSR
jgi:hypothetical protein